MKAWIVMLALGIVAAGYLYSREGRLVGGQGEVSSPGHFFHSPSPPLAQELMKILSKDGRSIILLVGRDGRMIGSWPLTSEMLKGKGYQAELRVDFGAGYRDKFFPIELREGKVDWAKYRVGAVIFDRGGQRLIPAFPNEELWQALEKRELARLRLKLVRVFSWEAEGVKRETELYRVE